MGWRCESAEGESGHVWKIEVTPFTNGLYVAWERKRGVKEDLMAFGLSNWTC